MNRILNFIGNNALVSSLAAAAISGVVAWGVKSRRDRHDSERIYKFLLASKSGTGFSFRSTEAIASYTKLPESRVSDLCAAHPKIRRNEKQLQSWTLAE